MPGSLNQGKKRFPGSPSVKTRNSGKIFRLGILGIANRARAI
jgi:hypothetical protein